MEFRLVGQATVVKKLKKWNKIMFQVDYFNCEYMYSMHDSKLKIFFFFFAFYN